MSSANYVERARHASTFSNRVALGPAPLFSGHPFWGDQRQSAAMTIVTEREDGEVRRLKARDADLGGGIRRRDLAGNAGVEKNGKVRTIIPLLPFLQ
jgi:hypothetical protein